MKITRIVRGRSVRQTVVEAVDAEGLTHTFGAVEFPELVLLVLEDIQLAQETQRLELAALREALPSIAFTMGALTGLKAEIARVIARDRERQAPTAPRRRRPRNVK